MTWYADTSLQVDHNSCNHIFRLYVFVIFCTGEGKEKSVADYFWFGFTKRYDLFQKVDSMGPFAIKIRIFPKINKAQMRIRAMIDGHALIIEGEKD